ncbi:FAD-dependent monooxygenase [Acidiferrimicrobium sp. IK]|uniref:FAD-dependent monooxygenase n=1 Tax=Acidiferrimicrobium sp. IK TaxID=2871700 RepID=UPI0021CAFD57|nr:FAD-dependent monooxygenase [Acidiferrimicrobium sp. IK]MCU4184491.1 FAD-dependent monooxygenase [Acidiferrimicrobium sp. IK]
MDGLNVAIVGGGIGGLCAALALRRAGHHPTVFERAEAFRPVGAGISVWANGVKVLDLLGLGPAVAAAGGRMDRMVYASGADGATLTSISLLALYARVGERAWPLARTALQEMLLGSLGRELVQTGMCCTGVSDHGPGVAVHFEDGGRAEADLVVAADGTHSALRSYVLGETVDRRYVGYVNWNGIVETDGDIVEADTWRTWVGEGMRASVMPVGGGRLYFFFDVPLPASALEDLPPAAAILPERFGGWAAPVRSLLRAALDGPINAAPIHDLPRLPTWNRGRVVLLGDAAHTMAPDLGQGGCQAMEDAVVLAHYLTTTNQSLDDALRRYGDERRPHTADIVRRARKRSDTTHGVDPAVTAAWYRALDGDDGTAILDGLAQSVETGPCR